MFRFGITGLLITGIHFISVIFLVEVLQVNPPIANGLAFFFSTIVSYIINTLWSFSSQLKGIVLFRFAIVSLIGFFLAISVAWMAQNYSLNYIVGTFFVAITVPPVTFLLHNYWTYNSIKHNLNSRKIK